MKKLKTQIFLLVFLILTVITTSVLCVYNMQTYRQELKAVERSLNDTVKLRFEGLGGSFGMVIDKPESDEKPDFENDFGKVRYMDTTVYTVFLDENNGVEGIINHSASSATDEEIAALAEQLMATGYTERTGNLYLTQYSFRFESGNYITIVDNSAANETLRETLLLTTILFLLLEILYAVIARRLSRRISQPVEESFTKQKQFIADASHELKTPLAVIMASADALEANPGEAKWLDNIKSESERMNKLIADLLDLAKSEAVEDKTQFAVGNLSKLVEKSVLTFEGVMFENGVLLEDNIEENITLNMDEYKIRQLLSILLDNAVKHSKSGGTVSVALKREKDIVLQVTNEGEGIPKGEEERIFERFYRADDSRNRNENRYGLGLAIAKNICRSHGASISAKSENGKTTFKVIFKS